MWAQGLCNWACSRKYINKHIPSLVPGWHVWSGNKLIWHFPTCQCDLMQLWCQMEFSFEDQLEFNTFRKGGGSSFTSMVCFQTTQAKEAFLYRASCKKPFLPLLVSGNKNHMGWHYYTLKFSHLPPQMLKALFCPLWKMVTNGREPLLLGSYPIPIEFFLKDACTQVQK